MQIPERHKIVRELVFRKGFRAFIPQFWPIIDPAQFVPGWHIDAIADHLEAVSKRQLRRLVINVPPGCGKSKLASVLWNAYHWIPDPAHKWMFASFDPGLVTRDARQMMSVVNSDLYRKAFPEAAMLGGSREITNIETLQGGMRLSTSVGGKATGRHAHTQVVDDPVKPLEAKKTSGQALKIANEWWMETMASRRAEPVSQFARVVIMQRLVIGDLADICLDEGYDHLCLPLEYVPNATWDRGSTLTRSGRFKDPRKTPGESLNPTRYPPEVLEEMEREYGPQGTSAQLQQNPTPDRGGYVERAWLDKEYESLPAAHNRMRFLQFWDLASKGREEDSHSRCHGLLVAVWSGNVYVVDERLGWWNYPETKKAFLQTQFHPMWARAGQIWVEDKANGTPLLEELKDDPQGRTRAFVGKLRAFEPGAVSKEDRFALETDKIEARLLWLPREQDQPWVKDWKDEIIKFPNDPKKTDRIDTLTMALNKCLRGGPGWATAATSAVRRIMERQRLARPAYR